MLELGLFSFGDTYPHPITGEREAAGDSLAHLLDRIALADQLGLHFYGVGEHHRPDFSVSACATVLAAAATRTKNIRLGTATIVLTTDDPVRLYEQFATLDQISGGRAELGVGSGVFLESFRLFGIDHSKRHPIFDQKLRTLAEIDSTGHVITPLGTREVVWPRPHGDHLPIWATIPPTPEAFARAAELGQSVTTSAKPDTLHDLAALIRTYRTAGRSAGWHESRLRVALGGHGYIGDTLDGAIDAFFPHYQKYVAGMRLNQGKPAPTRAQFEATVHDLGSNIFVGDPAHILRKLRHQHAILGHDRQLFQIDWRAVPHKAQLRAITLLATEVLPALQHQRAPVPALAH